ncbi:MAG: AraC family transcriptional regulator [Candidatus Delongbacteria bacterium]|nr:AraC family transcriptional regulator [Candidatus Delongbacteria bacterium]MBN2834111.1 AraC family transcriptional regulator [Candidatus Delongbacteria bacterium]
MSKKCESCGYLMEDESDYGGHDYDSRYCSFCTDGDGILKSFPEKLSDLTDLIIKKDKTMSREDAFNYAKKALLKMPAWKHIKPDDYKFRG